MSSVNTASKNDRNEGKNSTMRNGMRTTHNVINSATSKISQATSNAVKSVKKRGFGSMSPEKQKEIASMGGKASHAKGTAHRFNAEEAKEAGRKGGLTTSQNAEHMAEIGRKGGQMSRRASKSNNRGR